jgi:hypothetical protein
VPLAIYLADVESCSRQYFLQSHGLESFTFLDLLQQRSLACPVNANEKHFEDWLVEVAVVEAPY